jgi:DNA (cytosine-5)-methyltransferase 1
VEEKRMSRPVLYDLCCCAGGATKGYQEAGFYVVGVDIEPQPHYCGDEFILGDALTVDLSRAEALHASPPCQRYSLATPHNRRGHHPDLLPAVRERLHASGVPWIIENVPGAPMRADYSLCGCQFGLNLRRRRLFETSWHGFSLMSPCAHYGPVPSVVGHGTPSWVREQLGYNPTIADSRAAMGIDWMNRNELSEAIPPAYTRYLGAFLLDRLEAAA